jgi:hypothetical protein
MDHAMNASISLGGTTNDRRHPFGVRSDSHILAQVDVDGVKAGRSVGSPWLVPGHLIDTTCTCTRNMAGQMRREIYGS